MGYEKKIWYDRQAEHPNRRIFTPAAGGRGEQVFVDRDEGLVYEEGDAFDADTMNDLEDRIEQALDDVEKEAGASIAAHLADRGNPHGVSCGQIGALEAGARAADSAKLNGQAAGYYATASALNSVKSTAEGAVDSINNVKATADGALQRSGGTVTGRLTCGNQLVMNNAIHMQNSQAMVWLSPSGEARAYLGGDDNAWLDFRASGTGYLFRGASGSTQGIELITGTVMADNVPGSSSRRYKERIKPAGAADVQDLLEQEVVCFRYKAGCKCDDGGRRHIGLIAEEVEKSFPEAVYADGEGRVEGVNYAALVPYLLKLLQEHEARLARLEGKVETDGL